MSENSLDSMNSQLTAWQEKQKEEANKRWDCCRRLLLRDWAIEGDWFTHPKHKNQGLPMLFTFEDACKAEKL